MKKENQGLIDLLNKKYIEFKINGLNSYRKYIANELKKAVKSESKKVYIKYLEKELAKCDKRLRKLAGKLE